MMRYQIPHEIQGTTLVLHRIRRRHVITLRAIIKEMKPLIFPHPPKILHTNRIWFSNQSLIYVVEFNNAIVGWVGVRNVNLTTQSCSLEIVLSQIVWGTGVSVDVIQLMEYVVQTNLRLSIINIRINPDNERAQHFFEKMNYLPQNIKKDQKELLYRKHLN